jgi:tetratricopeptide (TPR) repeat protein
MRTSTLASLVVVLFAAAVSAQETPRLDPKGAWEAMQKELMEVRRARDFTTYRSLQQSKPREFLEAWDKAEGNAEGEQIYYLGLFYGAAGRHLDAIGAHRTCATDEELDANLREQARAAFAGAVYGAVNAKDLAGEAAVKAVAEVEALAAVAEKPETQGAMLQRAAYCLSALGKHEAAIERFLGAARANPALAYGAGRGAMGELMGGTWEMAAYDGLRMRGKAIITELTALHQKHIVELQAKGDEKTLARARSSSKRLADMTKPLDMLGKPAPTWTLVKAYGKTTAIEDHRGKVVMLDFWAHLVRLVHQELPGDPGGPP